MLDHSKVEGDLTTGSSTIFKEGDPFPSVKLVKKQFGGKYAISSEEFTSEMVRIADFSVPRSFLNCLLKYTN